MKTSRNYSLLLGSQFLSAFGDNVIRSVIIGQLTIQFNQGLISQSRLGMANAFYTILFVLPYVFGASIAGYLNDRFPKTRWLMGGNILKLLGTLFAAMSVWHGDNWQRLGYFVIGIGACFYGPAKYGILPEILPANRLVKANGTVELLTIFAILAGPVTGARLIDFVTEKSLPLLICFAVVAIIYSASLALNFFMTPTPFNPAVRLNTSTKEFFSHFRDLLRSPRLARILCGTGIFWLTGAVLQMNFQGWGLETLHLKNNTQISQLALWLGLGIIGGSLLAGQLHRIGDLRATQRYGLLLAGAILILSLVTKPVAVPATLIVIGMLAGLFLIPLNAALQAESDPAKLGKTIAAQNFIDNAAMTLGGIYVFGANTFQLNSQAIFSIFGALVILLILFLKIPKNVLANE